MKILILIFLSVSILFSQEFQIKVVDKDNNEKVYNLSEVDKIDFKLSKNTKIKLIESNQDFTDYTITENDEISFSETEIILKIDGNTNTIALSNLSEMQIIQSNNSKIPFGELEVDEILVNNLSNPWGLDFIDENQIIFTEISCKLYHYNIPTGKQTEISGLPQITVAGQGGLLDITLHPDFKTNKYIYLSYVVSESGKSTTAIGRGKYENFQLINFEEIFRGSPLINSSKHFGSRIVFDNDKFLYFSIGERGIMANAQDSTNHYGSVMKIYDDGRVPDDNPWLGKPNAKAELYTMGNRNIQGMFYLAEKDEIWANEHGAKGGDELNIIKKGANYAWPLATYGVNYDGSPISDKTTIPGYEDPITYWVPSIAPCGMDLISYDAETNEIDIIIGALAGQHLHRLLIKDDKVINSVKSLQNYARFRDVQLSPDGKLYAVTQSPGRLIRLKLK